MIPAFVVLMPTVATPLPFVIADSEIPTPVNRTFTPLTGFRERVTLATSACRAPFALTSFVAMVRTRHISGAGFGFATGFEAGAGLAVGLAVGLAAGGFVTVIGTSTV